MGKPTSHLRLSARNEAFFSLVPLIVVPNASKAEEVAVPRKAAGRSPASSIAVTDVNPPARIH